MTPLSLLPRRNIDNQREAIARQAADVRRRADDLSGLNERLTVSAHALEVREAGIIPHRTCRSSYNPWVNLAKLWAVRLPLMACGDATARDYTKGWTCLNTPNVLPRASPDETVIRTTWRSSQVAKPKVEEDRHT